jgi:hypothetical protein
MGDLFDKECCQKSLNLVIDKEVKEGNRKFVWYRCVVCNEIKLKKYNELKNVKK